MKNSDSQRLIGKIRLLNLCRVSLLLLNAIFRCIALALFTVSVFVLSIWFVSAVIAVEYFLPAFILSLLFWVIHTAFSDFPFKKNSHRYGPAGPSRTAIMIEEASDLDGLLAGYELALQIPANTSGTLAGRAIIRGTRQYEEALLFKSFRPMLKKLGNTFLLMLIALTGFISGIRPLLSTRIDLSAANLEIQPGSVTVPHGSDLHVSVTVRESPYSSVRQPEVLLGIRDTTGYTSHIRLDISDGQATRKLENITDDISYWFKYGGIRSREYVIKPFLPPFATEYLSFIEYPEYTRLPSATHRGGNIVAPVGSKATLSVKSSRPASSGRILWGNESSTPMIAEDSGEFYLKFEITESISYQVYLSDSEGRESLEPPIHRINAVDDNPPEIAITSPGQDIAAGAEAEIPIKIRARDDFGVSSVYLELYRDGVTSEISVGRYSPPRLDIVAEYRMDLRPMNMRPGHSIRYRATAHDNNTPAGTGFSQWFTITVPSSSLLLEEATRSQGEMLEQVRNILEKHQDIVEQTEKVLEEIRLEGKAGWQETRDLERLVAEEKALIGEARQLSQMLSENEKKLSETDMLTLHTLESMQRIRELLDSVIGEEMSDLLENMEKIASSVEIDPDIFEEFASSFDRADHLNRLKVFENLLERIKREMELSGIAAALEDIGYRQSMLSLENQQDSLMEALDKQQELIKDFHSTLNRMSGAATDLTGEHREKLVEISASQGSSTRQEMEEALTTLEHALGDVTEDGNIPAEALNQAWKHKTAAADGARDMAYQVRTLLAALQNQGREELLEQLSELLRNTVKLSRNIHDIRKSLRGMQGREARENAEKIAELRNLTLNYASLTVELSGKSALLDGIIPSLYMNTSDSLKEGAQVLDESNPGRAYAPLEMAGVHTGRAVTALVLASQRISTAESATGVEDLMRQLKDMADRQSGIGDATDDLLSSLMPGMSPAASEMMRRLAMEQAALARDLQQMYERMGQAGSAAGRLDQLAERMAEIARSMRSEAGGENIVSEQKQMVQRLLEARRALAKGREGRRREARRPSVMLTQPEQEGIEHLFHISGETAESIRSFSPADAPEAYRNLIRSYFRALSEFVQ